jgi:predicted permease
MSIIRQLAGGLRGLVRQRDADREVNDEVDHYLEQATAAHAARGLTPDAAIRAARLEVGNVTTVREQVRTAGWEHRLETTLGDVRYALRTLGRNRGFALVMILTLALGTGANTAIFSVAESVLLKPLPYPHDDQLLQLWSTGGKIALRAPGRGPLSWQLVQDVGALRQDVSGVAAFSESRYNLTGLGEPKEVQAALASPSIFDLVGVPPALGRGFAPSELHDRVVVLSHALWMQLFAGDSGAVGRLVTLDGNGFRVVGVMPAGFAFPDDATQLWAPLGQAFAAEPEMETNPDFLALNTIVRLRDRVDMRRLESDLAVVAARLPATPGLRPPGFAIMRLRDEDLGDARTPLLVLLAVVGFVLIIGCVNAANLLLARSSARQREFAVRRALGAGRGRLMRQLLTESIVLALAGGAVGLLLAEIGVSAILKAWPAVLPRTHQIGIDAATMGYALLISLVAGLAFGLAPAWRSSTAMTLDTSLREGSSTATAGPRRHRLQQGLVVAEIALALVVLTGAGLLVRSFMRLRSVDPGYDVHQVLAARIRLTPGRYASATEEVDFYQRAVEQLRRQPGVASASVSLTLPMSGEVAGFRWGMQNGDHMDIDEGIVAPDFFRTLRIPLVAGRAFTDGDRTNTQRVAIINAELAKHLWPNENPIGRSMDLRAGPTLVVGEIGNIHYASLTDPVKAEIYLPLSQGQAEFERRSETTAWIVARATHDPLALASGVRRAVGAVDPQQSVAAFTTLNEMVGRSTAARSFNMTLVSVFALLALGLAIVGIYGVMAYTVQQRTQEIGVRIALGAARGHILGLVLAQTGAMTAIGITIGLAGALALTRVLGTLLYDVSVTDGVTFAITTMVLAAAALLAALVPALRAARIDPVRALRSE